MREKEGARVGVRGSEKHSPSPAPAGGTGAPGWPVSSENRDRERAEGRRGGGRRQRRREKKKGGRKRGEKRQRERKSETEGQGQRDKAQRDTKRKTGAERNRDRRWRPGIPGTELDCVRDKVKQETEKDPSQGE